MTSVPKSRIKNKSFSGLMPLCVARARCLLSYLAGRLSPPLLLDDLGYRTCRRLGLGRRGVTLALDDLAQAELVPLCPSGAGCWVRATERGQAFVKGGNDE